MSSQYTIAILVGSLRKLSINQQLAKALEMLMPKEKVKFSYADLDVLPLFNQDSENSPPPSVLTMKERVVQARSVIFVTPEHNHSIPAALKNAIDWGSRPPGKNVWQGKPSGIIGTSYSARGTALAQQHLRNILAAEGSPSLTTPDIFLQFKDDLIDTSSYTINDDGVRQLLQKWIGCYLTWVDDNYQV